MKLFFVFLFSGFWLAVTAQPKICPVTNTAFQAGEEVTYELYYNWVNIPWTKVGFATFSVKEKKVKNKTFYHLIGTGSSYESWDWFYKMRAIYQAYVDPVTVVPYYYKRDVSEPTFFIDLEYKYNWKSNVAYSKYQSKKSPLTYDTIKIQPCVNDLVSVLYYARNLDYTGFKPGESIPITLLLDRKLYHIYFKYLGKEPIRVKGFGKYNCMKFSVYTVEGTMFHEGENMYVWVTDDKNKIPLQVETPILVGSIRATVISMKGMRNEMTSKIK